MAALALVIPLAFRGTPLQISPPFLEPFTATLASHVPEMLSILGGPIMAFSVGVASALGFLVTIGPVVGLRAFTHGIWGGLASWGYRRGWSFLKVMIVIALPIHALGEGVVVMAFGSPIQIQLVTIAGTAIHHLVDLAISLVILKIVQPLLAPIILTGLRIR
jgi:niacin transporter